MVEVRVVETIRCAPDEFLELVMDVERYQYVNTAIRPVQWVRRIGDRTDFAFPAFADSPFGRAVGPRVFLEMRRIAGYRIDIRLAGRPRNRLMRAFGELHGGFVCVEVDSGTQVTHTMRLTLKAWARWFGEPLLRKRLPAAVHAEVELAKEFLESSWLPGTA